MPNTSGTIVDIWDFKAGLATCREAVKIAEFPRGNANMNDVAGDDGG